MGQVFPIPDSPTMGRRKREFIDVAFQDLGATHVMAVREALHGKSLTPKGGFDNHDKHGVCQASTM